MKFVKRSEPPASPVSLQAIGDGDGLLKKFPAIREFMFTCLWDDGKPRETSTLLLFADADGLKACLNDRACMRSLWATGSSVLECLEALDAALQNGHAEWRAQRHVTRRGK